jgi:hypothetical protein
VVVARGRVGNPVGWTNRVRARSWQTLPRFENSRNVEIRTIELVAGKMFCYVLRDW